MARTAKVFTRVESKVKEQAEAILNQLGIPMSSAVGMFLRQVVIQRGIPFDVRLPAAAPLSYETLTKEQFDRELEAGMSDIKEGRVFTAEEVQDEMRREFGV